MTGSRAIKNGRSLLFHIAISAFPPKISQNETMEFFLRPTEFTVYKFTRTMENTRQRQKKKKRRRKKLNQILRKENVPKIPARR